jgi:hypothetical protein
MLIPPSPPVELPEMTDISTIAAVVTAISQRIDAIQAALTVEDPVLAAQIEALAGQTTTLSLNLAQYRQLQLNHDVRISQLGNSTPLEVTRAAIRAVLAEQNP